MECTSFQSHIKDFILLELYTMCRFHLMPFDGRLKTLIHKLYSCMFTIKILFFIYSYFSS